MTTVVISIAEAHQIEPVSINPSDWPPALVCVVVLGAISHAARVVASDTAGKGGRNKRQ